MFGGFNLNVRESHRHRAGGGSSKSLMLMSEAQVVAEPGREDTQGRGGRGGFNYNKTSLYMLNETTYLHMHI